MFRIFFLFFCIRHFWCQSQNVGLKLLYNENLDLHGATTSIDSMCEISSHHFIILGQDRIIRVYSLDTNFIFLNQITLNNYNHDITSVRCNGNAEAFLISPNKIPIFCRKYKFLWIVKIIQFWIDMIILFHSHSNPCASIFISSLNLWREFLWWHRVFLIILLTLTERVERRFLQILL